MEQERQKREGEETDFQTPNISTLCANSCGFFGNSATNNLCSKCYKDLVLSKSKAIAVESMVAPLIERDTIEKSSDSGDGHEEKNELSEIGNSSSEGGGPVVEVVKKKPSNRCSFCNKKVGLMGFKCRCEEVFCSLHRYSDKHNCLFDYKGTGQDAIAKANPVVKPDKVEKI